MRIKIVISAAVIMVAGAVSHAALAATVASATADLSIRAGPGPEYQIVGVIRANDRTVINGCIEGSLWCRVTYRGRTGWAYSQYLRTELSGVPVIISERRRELGVPVIAYERPVRGAATVGTAAGGAVAGAVVGGPIGAVVGGLSGAVAGSAIDDPPPEVRTYVTTHEVDPVYLEGEVVVGAGLPETVELRPVPDYDYRYVYVNRQPVLVDPATRRIVYIYRW